MKTLGSYHDIAEGQRMLVELCRRNTGGKSGMGQVEFKDGWTLVYRQEHKLC